MLKLVCYTSKITFATDSCVVGSTQAIARTAQTTQLNEEVRRLHDL